MYKLYFASKESLIIFFPGYKATSNELSFLRKYILREKGFSFLYLSYQLIKGGKNQPIKKITKELGEKINTFLTDHEFKNCYLMGYSLGAALALSVLVNERRKFSGLILISIFDDRKKLLVDRGIRIDEKNNISPIKFIKKAKNVPTLFIHGTNDRSVVIERAEKVFKESNKKFSKFKSIPGDHYFKDYRSRSFLNKCVVNFFKKPSVNL